MRHRWEISEESRALLPARGESGRLNRRTRCNSGRDDDRNDGDETTPFFGGWRYTRREIVLALGGLWSSIIKDGDGTVQSSIRADCAVDIGCPMLYGPCRAFLVLENETGYSDAGKHVQSKVRRVADAIQPRVPRQRHDFEVFEFVLYNGVSDPATRRPLALNRHQSVRLSCYFPQFPNPKRLAMHTLSFENIPSLLQPILTPLFQSVKMSLEPLGLRLQQLNRVQEQIVALELPRALYAVNEVISESSELDFVLELLVSQALSAHGVFHCVLNHSLSLAAHRVVFQLNHTAREAAAELLGVVSENGLFDLNARKQTVRSGRHG
jgi:hypothetical protein